MVLYTCCYCLFSSNQKNDYNRHLKTKKHNKNVSNNETNMVMSTNEHKMSTNEHKFSCEFCSELFATHANKRRHELHYCKENGSSKKIINEKNKLIKVMQKQIDKLIDKAGNTTITNNIQLNSYGNEDLSHITDKIKASMLKIPYGMIPKMVEAIHFNDNKPENKNIILPNKRDNKIQIFRHNKWVYKTKDEVISDLIDGKYFIMETFYDDNLTNFDPNDLVNFIKFKKIFEKSDKDLIEHIKNECELVMLNNR